MKYDCEMIADLLPLYKDGVCSPASARAVEEHIAECRACRDILDKMDDVCIDQEIAREKNEIIESQSRFFKRRSALIGAIIAAVFAVPVLVCLIVNLVNGSGLSWFFIVLTAMLIPASLIVVPLMVPENRMLITMASFTGSLMLLLAATCIYSGGSWFFIAASSVLFGLTVCFAPFIVSRSPVNKYLEGKKGLAVMSAYTLTYILMILCIGLSIRTPGYFTTALGISGPIIAVAWVLFLIIRYLPANGFVKAGASVAVASVFGYFASDIIEYFVEGAVTDGAYVYFEPSLPVMLAGLAVAAVLIGAGVIKGMNTKEDK